MSFQSFTYILSVASANTAEGDSNAIRFARSSAVHPGCVELGPDTIRKCREYPWQCAECKTCGQCSRPADDDKMLFCDLCDRGFHSYCVGLPEVPTGNRKQTSIN